MPCRIWMSGSPNYKWCVKGVKRAPPSLATNCSRPSVSLKAVAALVAFYICFENYVLRVWGTRAPGP